MAVAGADRDKAVIHNRGDGLRRTVQRETAGPGWLEAALLESARCHQVAERRSPAQRHCPECAASVRGARSREAVAYRRRQA